jgi:hypothetical protein
LKPRDAANDFLAAAALDPANTLVLANVQSFYELMAAPATAVKIDDAYAISADEVQSQLVKVRALRQGAPSG